MASRRKRASGRMPRDHRSITSAAKLDHRGRLVQYAKYQSPTRQIPPLQERRNFSVRKLIALMFCVAVCAIALGQQSLNNASVTKMVNAGLSDDVVIATINSSPGQYTTSPDALIALKQAGVSDKVIAAMV